MDKQEFIQKMKDQPFSVLSDLVYQYIVGAIVKIHFPPGSKINAKRPSEELGISRTPIHTALEHPIEQKLVEQVDEKGFRICQIDWKDCMALYDIRGMIESSAAYIAANIITEAQLKQLRFLIPAAREARVNSDILVLFETNNRFHDVIVLSTGNNYLIDIYESLKTQIHRYQHSLITAQKYGININQQTSVDRHITIYRAIKSRYSMVARTEMKGYLHYIYRVLLDGGLITRSPVGNEDRQMEQNDSTLFISSRDAAGLNQRVYEHILRQIIGVQIEPDGRINVTRVAEQLQISRTPIRSTMDQLVKGGLIRRVSGHGYQVIPINMVDCFNLCGARKILEGTAAVMATSNITPPELEVLEHNTARAKECLAYQDYNAFAGQDTIFHETLLRAAGSRYLLQVYDTLKIYINRYRYVISTYYHNSAEQDTNHIIAKRLCIFRATKSRYGSVTQNEMEEHIAYTYRALFDLGYLIRKNGLE